MRLIQISRALTATMLGVMLAACGGGGDDDKRVQVKAITVFGDSLSDVGTYAINTGDPANKGKFTTNPGNLWVENLAAQYGLKLTPNRSVVKGGAATVIGGNGYAEGGARVSKLPGQSAVGNNNDLTPVRQQITNRLAAKGKFQPDELVIITAGPNDIYAQFDAVYWSVTYGEDVAAALTIATAEVEQAARDLVGEVKRIQANGAPVILVGNSISFSVVPFAAQYLTAAQRTLIDQWTARFNAILKDGIAGVPGVTTVDIESKVFDMVAKPASYGLINVTAQACNNTTPGTAAVWCTQATLVAPGADQTYLFSDNFHVTTRGNKIISDAAAAKLAAVAR